MSNRLLSIGLLGISLFMVNICASAQTKDISLSPPFDKLKLPKTPISQVKKQIGKPDTITHFDELGNIGGGCLDLSCATVYYHSFHVILRSKGYYQKPVDKRRLTTIDIFDSSQIAIDTSIKVGISTLSDIVKKFGIPYDTIVNHGTPSDLYDEPSIIIDKGKASHQGKPIKSFNYKNTTEYGYKLKKGMRVDFYVDKDNVLRCAEIWWDFLWDIWK